MLEGCKVIPEKPFFPHAPLGSEESIGILESKIYSEEELARRKPKRSSYPYSTPSGEHDLVIFGYDKSLRDELETTISEEKANQMLEILLLGRELEKISVMLKYPAFGYTYGDLKVTTLKHEGLTLNFPTHLAIGQEGMSVGSIFAIDPEDFITSTHRGHVDALVKGYRYLVNMSETSLDELVEQNRGIADRLELSRNPHGREEILEQGVDIHIYRTIAELFGKKDGYCNGVGGGMHLAWCDANNLGNNAIVGGLVGAGAGSGIASKYLQDGRTTLAIAGDGAYLNENAYGAINLATMRQYRNGLMSTNDGPHVVFVCYNNQYAMTCQQRNEVTSNKFLSERYIGFNEDGLHTETAFGMDVLAVHDLIRRAKKTCDDGNGPVFSELWGIRFTGHSLSDDALNLSRRGKETYRSREEILEWKNYDPVSLYASEMVLAGLVTEDSFRKLETEVRERVQRLTKIAAAAEFPHTREMLFGLYTDTTSDNIPAEFAGPKSVGDPITFERDADGKIKYDQAIVEGIAQEMRRDARVLLFGEDLADYGGAFGETSGLLSEFGRDRVFNTPLCEANIAGTAIGMGLRGLRPISKSSMYIDFLTLALDQIANHAAKLPYMSGGQLKVPAVFWTDMGGGMGYAGQHSQSLEAMVTMFPGLKVVAPATSYDAKGLMISSIRDDNPIVFIGHQNLYKRVKCDSSGFREVPEDPFTVDIGKAYIVKGIKSESDNAITMISYSWMLYNTLSAAEMIENDGYEVEVIDLRTLLPLDTDTIYKSVKRTGRVIIAQQSCIGGGLGERIAGKIISDKMPDDTGYFVRDFLKAPVRIVGAPFSVPPCALTLETSFTKSDGSRNTGFIPGDVEIYNAAKEILVD